LALVLAIGGLYLYIRIEQKEYPRVTNYVSTIISAPIQSTYFVLATDFEHQSVWYTANKKQEMVTPPPYNAVGSIRIMNGEKPFGKPAKLWEKLVAADSENYSWSYSVLDYNESNIHFSPIPPFYGHRTDSTMYPITTHGNNACFLEWIIHQNSPLPLKLLDVENIVIFKGFFKDLEVYLDKKEEHESNPIYSVKEINDKTIQLKIRQGTVISSHHDLWKKAKNFRTNAINIQDERDDLPKSYELVNDNLRSVRAFRSVTISPQGKAEPRFNAHHLVYVSIDDTFTLPKSANNDKDRATYISQVQETFTNYVKELS